MERETTHLHDIEHNGVHQSGHPHTNGPPSNAEAIALGSQITGEDLGGNQKGDCSPSGRISSLVSESFMEWLQWTHPRLNKNNISTAPGAY